MNYINEMQKAIDYIEINLDKIRCGNLLKKFFKLRRFD